MKNLNLLYLATILICLSCNQERYLSDSVLSQSGKFENKSINLNFINSTTTLPSVGGMPPVGEDLYPCSENPGYCELTPCPPFGCTRANLDPCDYSNMADYANAVVCILNKHVNPPCGTLPGLPLGCYEITQCFKNLHVPADLIAYFGGEIINPWRYCATATCGEYLCPSPFGDINHHLYLDIVAQDILIAYAQDLAFRKRPDCSESYPAVPYLIKFVSCYDITQQPPGPFQCFPYHSVFCTNMSIKLQISYKCCFG